MIWRVAATVTGSTYLGEVEADTREEAEAKAWSELAAAPSFCHQCSSGCEDPEITEIVVEPDSEAAEGAGGGR